MKAKKSNQKFLFITLFLITIPYISYTTMICADSSDASSWVYPGEVGFWETNGTYGIDIEGDYAYIADKDLDLGVIDIIDPNNPQLSSSLQTTQEGRDIDVSGNIAYQVNDQNINIINVSDPKNPILIESFSEATSSQYTGVVVDGNSLYVTCSVLMSSLFSYNITDPLHPILMDQYSLSGTTTCLEISGDVAYIGQIDYGMMCVNISEPQNLQYLGEFMAVGDVMDIHIDGDVAYLAANDTGLWALDISNPKIPDSMGQLTGFQGPVYCVTTWGNLAFVGDYGNEIRCVNIKNPKNMDFVFIENIHHDYNVFPVSLETDGEYLYVADSLWGFRVIQINSANKQFGMISNYYESGFQIRRAGVDGNILFMLDRERGLFTLNFTDPSNIGYLDEYNLPDDAWDFKISGDVAYITDINSTFGGLTSIDISDPSNLTQLDQFITTSPVNAIDIQGNIAFIGESFGGVQLLNISDPSNINWISTYQHSVMNSPVDIEVKGNTMFIAYEDEGLIIVNITDPLNPTFISELKTLGSIELVETFGNTALIANEISGFSLLNITNVESPVIMKNTSLQSLVIGANIVGDMLYLACGEDGIYSYDISELTNPVQIDTDNTIGYAEDITNWGHLSLVSDDNNGLVLYNTAYYGGDDPDGDQLSFWSEVWVTGSNPQQIDTDGDGLNDNDEVNYGTNPRNSDTDGDGYSDYDEIFEHETDPNDSSSLPEITGWSFPFDKGTFAVIVSCLIAAVFALGIVKAVKGKKKKKVFKDTKEPKFFN